MTYIWTLAADTNDGLLTSVYPTEMEADGAARDLIEEYWTRFKGTDMPLNHWDAYEIMNEGAGFMDTIQIDKHKLMIPAPQAAQKPLVVVTVSGGVAEIQCEDEPAVLTILYDFDGNDVSDEEEHVVMPEIKGKPDWAAIRREAEAQEG